MADGRKMRRKAMEMSAMDQRRKTDQIRQKERSISEDERTRRILGSLNREQQKMWKSYSPSRQRKILLEVERKLERKNARDTDFEKRPSSDRIPDADALADGESGYEYHNRGHPEKSGIRKVEMSDIRMRRMELRLGRDSSRKREIAQSPDRKAAASGMALESSMKALRDKEPLRGNCGRSASGKGLAVSEGGSVSNGKRVAIRDAAGSRGWKKNRERRGAPGGLAKKGAIPEAEGKARGGASKSAERLMDKKRIARSLAMAEGGALPGRDLFWIFRRPAILGERQHHDVDYAQADGTGKGRRSWRFLTGNRKDRKRELSYRRSFLRELAFIIDRDTRKDENIKRAQKTGQITQSIGELTGQSARSSVRISAIPLRVSLGILARRLRNEIKKRLREAAASLIRHAAIFGAPVFAIVIIVMLLSAICMIGTSETPDGYGLGYQIVEEAKKHLGLPYVYGGTSLKDGCDCSGFVWAIYHLFGYNLPRTAGAQYTYGRKVGKKVSDWQLGDLIYYSRTGSVQSGGGRAEHIVIYIGGGQVISCGPVAIYNWDYRSDYYGTCRIIPDEPLGGDFSGSTNEEICWNYFISKGFSRAATAGILGNMFVESAGTFNPSIHQFGGGPGRGLCQWEESYSGGSGRYNKLVSFAKRIGKKWNDISAQLMFASHEMDSGQLNPYFSKFGGVEKFKRSRDPATAAYVFLCGFEYCGDPGRSFLEANFSLSMRESHARWAFRTYG